MSPAHRLLKVHDGETSQQHSVTYKEDSTTPHSSRTSPDFRSLVIFIILEAGYIALTLYCLWSPRRLPIANYSTTLVKGGVVAIFTLWHTTAVAFAAGVCTDTFSREWAARQLPTDVVSTVTASLLDRASCFFTTRATKMFKIAFVAFVIPLAVGTTGRSAITASFGADFPTTISIAVFNSKNATLGVGHDHFDDLFVLTAYVIQLEKVVGLPVGYAPEPNWIIPLPAVNQSLSSRVSYETDLVHFQHSCEWRAPDRLNGSAVFINGELWRFYAERDIDLDILPVYNHTNGSTIRPLMTPELGRAQGRSAYLLLGGNSTFPIANPTIPNVTYVDLSDLPALYDPHQFTLPNLLSDRPSESSFMTSYLFLTSPLATVLMCTPKLDFTTGTVALGRNANISGLDLTITLPTGGPQPPGTIQPNVISEIFAASLFYPTSLPNVIHKGTLKFYTVSANEIASQVFLGIPRAGYSLNSSAVRPLPLDMINRNLDDYMLSALKVFTSVRNEVANGAEVSIPARVRIDDFVLASSHLFALLHLALVTTSTVLLVTLVNSNIRQPRVPFGLEHIRVHDLPPPTENTASRENEPLMEKGGETSEEDSVASKPRCTHSNTSHPPESNFSDICSLAIFIALEAAFIVLALYCLWSPRQLPITNHSTAFVRSGFITVFTLWHLIALAFGSRACTNAFSREWAACQPQTDVISTVTSSLLGRMEYFFTSRATKTYWTAFITSLILLVMGTTGPSTISASFGIDFPSTVPITIIKPMNLSDERFVASDGVTIEGRFIEVMEEVFLEKNHVPVGYTSQPNWMNPLPAMSQIVSSHISHETDLVHFQHYCEWKAPTRFNGPYPFVDNQFWDIAGTWPLDPSQIYKSESGSNIIPLTPEESKTIQGKSAYLFYGGNSTLPMTNSESPNFTYIDLSHLPCLYEPRNFNFTSLVGSPLATVLVCTPNFEFTTGTAVLEPSNGNSKPDLTVALPTGGPRSLGNIHPNAAGQIFSTSLSPVMANGINHLAADTFMNPLKTGNRQKSSAVQPLAPEIISSRLGDYMLSALKAFTSVPLSTNRSAGNQDDLWVRVPGVYRFDGFALGTSSVFALLHLPLTMISAVLLVILTALNIKQRRAPFDLRHIREVQGLF